MLFVNTYMQPTRYRWIPGDGGYVQSKKWDGKPGHEGENVIYLGKDGTDGCFETEEAAFLPRALFWGHGLGRLTLPAIEAEVKKWVKPGTTGEAETLSDRTYLRQPLPQ